MKRRIASVLMVAVMILGLLPLQTKLAHANSSVVGTGSNARDDGIWFFPLKYPAAYTDWAGCNSAPGVVGTCPFHGSSCQRPNNDDCAAYHCTGLGHNGIDLAAYLAPVYAASNGKVVYYGNPYDGRGNTMVIEHHIAGSGSSYYSYYQHLNNATVSVGTTVTAGTQIAVSGNTGNYENQYPYHLHFGIVLGVENQVSSENMRYIGVMEGNGWLRNKEADSRNPQGRGRIVVNPKDGNTNLATVNAHCGSVTYVYGEDSASATDWTQLQCTGNYTALQATIIHSTPFDQSTNTVTNLPKDAHVIVHAAVKNKYNNTWYEVEYGPYSGFVYAPRLSKYSNDTAQYYLDVNGILDGTSSGGISGYGTCDVYINGISVISGTDDYYKKWPTGTSFKVVAKVNSGKEFVKGTVSGATQGSFTAGTKTAIGIIGSQTARVVLEYKTKPSQWATITSGNYYIKNVATKKYLDASGAGDYNNCDVVNWVFNGSSAQTWNITGSATSYKVKPTCTSSRVLNQYGNTVASGHNVCLWDNTNDPSQRWVFEKISGNQYIIHCAGNTNCVLDVNDNGSVYVSTYVSGKASQKWELTSEFTLSGDYFIKNNSTGKYMNVNGSGDYNNCDVNTATKNGSSAQKWNISGASYNYMVMPKCSSSRVLNQYGDYVVSGHNVCLWVNTYDPSQRWTFEKVGDNKYVIHCVGNENCVLDVNSNGSVYVNTYSAGKSSQIWVLER